MSTLSFISEKSTSSENYHRLTSLIVPRPIAWVSTLNSNGSVNLAPFSFFNGVSSNPPCLSVSIARKPDSTKKDTLLNIERSGEFVVNVSHDWLAPTINQTSAPFPHGVSEVEACGLNTDVSTLIQPPRIRESLAQFECRTEKLVEIGDGTAGSSVLVIGRILVTHIDSTLFDEKGRIDPEKLKPVSRFGGSLWGHEEKTFSLTRPLAAPGKE